MTDIKSTNIDGLETGGIIPRDYQWLAYNETAHHIRHYSGPAFIEASVGAGKTVMIGMIAKRCQDVGMPVLVLARQGELIDQTAKTLWDLGVKNSIFSASLGIKSRTFPVICGTEGTVCRALDNELEDFTPGLILIDECHTVNWEDVLQDEPETQYGKIIKAMLDRNPKLRILGYSGSPFRGVESIVGDFWKKRLTDIGTEYLVKRGYLTPTTFGFGHDDIQYDLSDWKSNGEEGAKDFTSKELQAMQRKILKEGTTTQRIMLEVQEIARDRKGVLITCAGKRHCEEAAKFLPEGSYGIVTESISTKARKEILDKARNEELKYVFQVGCLTTGVDVKPWDTIVILRNIGSLTLLVQLIGRGLRPYIKDQDILSEYLQTSPEQDERRRELLSASDAPDCLVLDYSGTMHELGELYQNPILEAAELERAKINNDYITCPKCSTQNSSFARRCIGVDVRSMDGRCEFFWQSVPCKECNAENDIAARDCRQCGAQLIDPNANLSGKHYTEGDYKKVLGFDMRLTKNKEGVIAEYRMANNETAIEVYYPKSAKKIARTMWVQKFAKVHVRDTNFRSKAAYEWPATTIVKMKAVFDVPTHITHRVNDKGKSVIHKKRFRTGREDVANNS